MARLTPDLSNAAFDEFSSSTSTLDTTTIGGRITGGDGRDFRLVKVGSGAALVSGKLYQGSAIVANHQNMVTSTQAAGDGTITVTLGNTAATANQYAGGYVVVNAGTGVGQTLKISSHPAANALATLVLTLEDTVAIATLASDSKTSLMANQYLNVVINPTTPTAAPVGIAVFNAAASSYAWVQTRGSVSALNDAGSTVGLGLKPSTNTAGALMTVDATGTQIATAQQTGVTTEYRFVFMLLD